jgi:hypothetical protein
MFATDDEQSREGTPSGSAHIDAQPNGRSQPEFAKFSSISELNLIDARSISKPIHAAVANPWQAPTVARLSSDTA